MVPWARRYAVSFLVLFSFTVLIAQFFDQLLPFVGSRKAAVLPVRMHFDEQRRTVQILGITGRRDHIGREGCSLNQIFRQPGVSFEASDILRQIAENKQGYIAAAGDALLEAGCYLPGRMKWQGIFLFDTAIFFNDPIKQGERLHVGLGQTVAATTSSGSGFLQENVFLPTNPLEPLLLSYETDRDAWWSRP